MLPNIEAATSQLKLIPDILRAADPELYQHLSLLQPFFALSVTLTMYAHEVQSLGEISRLFDVLLAREPVFSVYMFAAIVRSRRDELFEVPADDTDTLHFILSKLPRNLDMEAVIASALTLIKRHPPETLRAWRAISAASALKTARSTKDCAAQTIQDGEAYFRQQVRELEAEQRKRKRNEMFFRTYLKYRRPMQTFGLAFTVGVLALWLRRSPNAMALFSWPFSR